MEKRIHISKIWAVMDQRDKARNLKPFSFQYAKKNGELHSYKNATLTSFHSKGSTVNILLDGDKTPETFRKICFMRFNEFKIYI